MSTRCSISKRLNPGFLHLIDSFLLGAAAWPGGGELCGVLPDDAGAGARHLQDDGPPGLPSGGLRARGVYQRRAGALCGVYAGRVCNHHGFLI